METEIFSEGFGWVEYRWDLIDARFSASFSIGENFERKLWKLLDFGQISDAFLDFSDFETS